MEMTTNRTAEGIIKRVRSIGYEALTVFESVQNMKDLKEATFQCSMLYKASELLEFIDDEDIQDFAEFEKLLDAIENQYKKYSELIEIINS